MSERLATKEVWKFVPGFEGVYEVSNTGTVRRISRTIFRPSDGVKQTYRAKVLAGSICSGGYRVFSFRKPGQKKVDIRLHRLLALIFIPNPDNKPQVNHIDGNKLNNNLDNLEWVTGSENIKHANRTGLIDNRGEKSGNAKLTKEEVLFIRELAQQGHTHKQISEKVYGKVNRRHIGDIVNRKCWKHLKTA